MGFMAIICLMSAVVVFGVEAGPSGSRRCPPPNKVYYTKPVCRDDYDCNKFGKICCPNQAHSKSCTYPAPYTIGDNHRNENNTSTSNIAPDLHKEPKESLDATTGNQAVTTSDLSSTQSKDFSESNKYSDTSPNKFKDLTENQQEQGRTGSKLGDTLLNERNDTNTEPILYRGQTKHSDSSSEKSEKTAKPKYSRKLHEYKETQLRKHLRQLPEKHKVSVPKPQRLPSSDNHIESIESKPNHHSPLNNHDDFAQSKSFPRPSSVELQKTTEPRHSWSQSSDNHKKSTNLSQRLTPQSNKNVISTGQRSHLKDRHIMHIRSKHRLALHQGLSSDRGVGLTEPRQRVNPIGLYPYFPINQSLMRSQPAVFMLSPVSSTSMRRPRGLLRWG